MATRTVLNKNFYVYFHINPITNKVFYVGKGFGNRAYCTKGRNPYWNNIFKKNSMIVKIIKDKLTEKKALEVEMYYIKKIGRDSLTNMTDGGDGIKKGERLSIATEFKKGQKPSNYGKKTVGKCKICTGEIRIFNSSLAIYCSKKCQSRDLEWKQKISKTKKEKKQLPPLTPLKSVDQFDKLGNYIKTFNGVTIAQKLTGAKHISKVCKNERKTSGGFIWKYTDVKGGGYRN